MKRVAFAAVVTLVLGFSTFAQAALVDNNLIYDKDLNVSRYDCKAGDMICADIVDPGRNPAVAADSSTHNYNDGYAGPIDRSYGITGPGGELAYLSYIEPDSEAGGPMNRGPFDGLLSNWYWSVAEHAAIRRHERPVDFDPGFGFCRREGDTWLAWARHHRDDGFEVPIPAAGLLFGPGLVCVAAVRTRFKKWTH